MEVYMKDTKFNADKSNIGGKDNLGKKDTNLRDSGKLDKDKNVGTGSAAWKDNKNVGNAGKDIKKDKYK